MSYTRYQKIADQNLNVFEMLRNIAEHIIQQLHLWHECIENKKYNESANLSQEINDVFIMVCSGCAPDSEEKLLQCPSDQLQNLSFLERIAFFFMQSSHMFGTLNRTHDLKICQKMIQSFVQFQQTMEQHAQDILKHDD